MAKCKKVHIGIFFDGTGNNKSKDKPLGKMSNIAKLSDLYIHGKIINWSDESCDTYGHMIYKEGVGTGGGIDTATGGGAGSGGAKRINEAIDKLVYLLSVDYPALDEKTGVGYRERIIDVFGFSRGAAMARDFINTFYSRNRQRLGLTKIKFNFVGLYDTVGSFGKAGNNINYKPKDPSKDSESLLFENEHDEDFEPYNFVLAHNSAEKIVHMIASDEVRKNFPLSSIMPIGGSHVEWTYGGVHSDIGGGYEPKMTEKHSFVVGRFVSYYDSEIAIEQTKKKLSSKWQFYRIPEPRVNLLGNVMNRVHHAHAFNNREVTNEITFVSLYRMHEEALRAKVPFKPMIISMPASMKEYDSHTKVNPSSAMSFEDMPLLRGKYFHHSAVDQDEIDTHRDPDGVGERLGNDTNYDNHKPKRDIYSNKGRAIPPTKF